MDANSDDVPGRYTRRRILAVGGFSVGVAALVAACAPDRATPQIPQAGLAPTTTGLAEQNVSDDVLLRTSSSLDHSLTAAYDIVLALKALPTDVTNVVQRFRAHHAEHATFFENLTRDIGGQPFTGVNDALQKNVIDPALKAINDAGNKPDDLLWFIYGLENLAAGTLQSFVPTLDVPRLRGSVMSVGGTEARQAALAAGLVPKSTVVAPTELQQVLAAPTSTSSAPTTVPGETTTSTPANELIAVARVPGAFGSQTAVSVAIAGKEQTWQLLGPNSFEYPATPPS